MMLHQDPYQVLGVTPDVDEQTLKRAYRSLIRKYHPDVSDDPNGLEISKRIISAYEKILNSLKGGTIDDSGYQEETVESREVVVSFDFDGEHVELAMDLNFFEMMSLRDPIQDFARRNGLERFVNDHFDALYRSAYIENERKAEQRMLQGASEGGQELQLALHEDVVFEDNLIAMVARIYLGNSSGPVAISQLQSIRELDLSSLPWDSLEDIRLFSNLEMLDLSLTDVRDLSPLQDLPQLRELYLSKCGSFSLEQIRDLNRLEVFDLSNNGIRELGFVACYPLLKGLFLSNNQIADLAGIDACAELSRLDLSANPVKDLTLLKQLPKLEYLNLNWTRVDDFIPLLEMAALKFVDVSYLSDSVLERNAAIWEALRQRGVFVKMDLN